MAAVVILDRKHWKGLKSTPSDGEDEWIAVFENFREPAVSFEPHLHEPGRFFGTSEATDEQRATRIEVVYELAWNACES
jgi:hypothetical protein